MATATISKNSSSTTRGVVRWLFRETMGIVMAGVILFFCADGGTGSGAGQPLSSSHSGSVQLRSQ